LRLPREQRTHRRTGGAARRVRGTARADAPGARADARAAPRPAQRGLRARDGRRVQAPARAHRDAPGARAAGTADAPALGKGTRACAEPRAERRVKGARVAVVGGGLAGIAAALDLADAGASVTLFEARTRLGGATYSVRRKDHWIDNGQHVLLRCCTAYRGFLARLGVQELVPIQPRLRVPILREGKPPA